MWEKISLSGFNHRAQNLSEKKKMLFAVRTESLYLMRTDNLAVLERRQSFLTFMHPFLRHFFALLSSLGESKWGDQWLCQVKESRTFVNSRADSEALLDTKLTSVWSPACSLRLLCFRPIRLSLLETNNFTSMFFATKLWLSLCCWATTEIYKIYHNCMMVFKNILVIVK